MGFFTSRLQQALCGLALLAACQAQAAPTYTADFNSSTLDPGLTASMFRNGSWSPGVVLPWTVSSGSGFMALAKTFTLPGNVYADGPHVQTTFGTTGDFIATVTADSSYNGAGGAGFFMDSAYGYTGIGFGTSWLWDSAGNGYTSTGYNGTSTPQVTLQIKRIGDTLTKAYKLDGESDFTVISTLTDAAIVPGWVIFDLTNSSAATAATAVLFTSFTIEQLAPVPEAQSWAMLLAGLGLLGLTAYRRRPH